jgi:hypothetical protein
MRSVGLLEDSNITIRALSLKGYTGITFDGWIKRICICRHA